MQAKMTSDTKKWFEEISEMTAANAANGMDRQITPNVVVQACHCVQFSRR